MNDRPGLFGISLGLIFAASNGLAAAQTVAVPRPVRVAVFCAVLMSLSWPITRTFIRATSFHRYVTIAIATGRVLGLLEHGDYLLAGVLIVSTIGFDYFRRRSGRQSLT